MASRNKLLEDFKFENGDNTFGILTDGEFFISKKDVDHLHRKLSPLGFSRRDYRKSPIAHYRRKDRWFLTEVLGRGAELVDGDILGGDYVVKHSYQVTPRSLLIEEAKRAFPGREIFEMDWTKSPGWTEAKMNYLISMIRLSDADKQICPECRGFGLESVVHAEISNGRNVIEKKEWDCRTCLGCSYVPKDESMLFRTGHPRISAESDELPQY